MAETKLAPLSTQVPIVDAKTGNPTPYFQQLMQIFIDEKNATADDVTDIGTEIDNLTLDDLADVDLVTTPPEDGDALVYDEDLLTWVPGAGSGSGGDLGMLHVNQTIPGSASAGGSHTSFHGRGLNTIVSNTILGATAIPSATVTMTIASPCVVTWNNHGLTNGTPIMLRTTGALPTGLSVDQTVYVSGATTNTFNLSAVGGGAAINTSGAQSGVHTAYAGQFTLPAGTYDIISGCTGHVATAHAYKSRLYNVTDGVEQPNTAGVSSTSNVNSERYMNIMGRFTIASEKVFQLQTVSNVATTVWGHGVASAAGGVGSVFSNTIIRAVEAGVAPVPVDGTWTSLYANSALTNPTTEIIVDVTGYQDVMVIGRAVTLASSGYRTVHVSVDGGSTYYKTSGDYAAFGQDGVESNNFVALNHNVSSSAARDFGGIIWGRDQSNGPKIMQSFAESGANRYFVASNNPITHIRICGIAASAGALINMTGGQVYVYGR